jgi:hypothetical protein
VSTKTSTSKQQPAAQVEPADDRALRPPPLADDLLFGAQRIADELGVDVRRAFYMLEHGQIPARKVGATWTASRERLRQFFFGESVAAAPEPAPTKRKSLTRRRVKAAA